MSDRFEGFAIRRVYPPGDPLLAAGWVELESPPGERVRVEIEPELMLELAEYFGASAGHIPDGQRFSATSPTPRGAFEELCMRVATVPALTEPPPFARVFGADRRAEVEAAVRDVQRLLRALTGPVLGQPFGLRIRVVLIDAHAFRADLEIVAQYLIVRAIVRNTGWQLGVVRPRLASD